MRRATEVGTVADGIDLGVKVSVKFTIATEQQTLFLLIRDVCLSVIGAKFRIRQQGIYTLRHKKEPLDKSLLFDQESNNVNEI